MRILQRYSHKAGEKYIQGNHSSELKEIEEAIACLDPVSCLRKVSEEKTMPDYLLFSPPAFNKAIKNCLYPLGWAKKIGKNSYQQPFIEFDGGRFRESDGIKNRVGLEIQFGKYAFMGYDIFSKGIIFKNRGLIDCMIEVVAVAAVVKEMSTGVSEFEQILIDFKERGEADIDIPTLVLGIALTDLEVVACAEKRLRFKANPEALYIAGEVDRGKRKTPPGPKYSEPLLPPV